MRTRRVFDPDGYEWHIRWSLPWHLPRRRGAGDVSPLDVLDFPGDDLVGGLVLVIVVAVAFAVAVVLFLPLFIFLLEIPLALAVLGWRVARGRWVVVAQGRDRFARTARGWNDARTAVDDASEAIRSGAHLPPPGWKRI